MTTTGTIPPDAGPAAIRASPWARREWLLGGALVLITLAAFARLPWCGFVNFDDNAYVYSNPHVQAGLTLPGVRWALTTIDTGYWHPLTWLSLMLDATLWGTGPAGFHCTNLLIHVLNVLLVFGLFRRLTGATWRAALLAGLFAVHPLRVESVAWISERKDVLSSLFGLLTLWAYVGYARSRRWSLYGLTLVLFALSLMAKPMLVTLPGIMLLLDYWPLERLGGRRTGSFGGTALLGGVSGSGGQEGPDTGWKPGATLPSLARVILEKLVPLGMAAAVSVAAMIAQHRVGTMATLSDRGLMARLAGIPLGYATYLADMFWPAKLAVIYPMGTTVPVLRATVAALVVALISGVALWRWRTWPHLIVGWLWFLGMLLPVIGVLQVGNQATADRYTYLPSLGVGLMVIWSIPARGWAQPAARAWAGGGALAVLGVLAVLTWVQTQYWASGLALFTRTVAVTKGNWLAENNLGNALVGAKREDEAVRHYENALQIDPDYNLARLNLGELATHRSERTGDPAGYRDAVYWYSEALRHKPGDPVFEKSLADVLAKLGDVPGACAHYERAIGLDDNYADAQSNFGQLLARIGNIRDAVIHLGKAAALHPNSAEAHFNFGVALGLGGDAPGAIAQYRRALECNPKFERARENLAKVGQGSTLPR